MRKRQRCVDKLEYCKVLQVKSKTESTTDQIRNCQMKHLKGMRRKDTPVVRFENVNDSAL